MNRDKIKQLSPSAARLLLTFIYGTGKETFDEVIDLSGIRTYATYQQAMEQLKALGFVTEQGDKLYIDLRKEAS